MSEQDNNADLVDIRDVRVDSSLPKQERIAEYLRQIKNPNHYMCIGWEVKEKHAGEDAPTIEDCLERIVGVS
jgi:Mg2+/Co2+ transporter CorC